MNSRQVGEDPRAGSVSERREPQTQLRVRVLPGVCPNLLAEAELYHYQSATDSRRGENPEDEHNHALAALRYLIAQLDARKLGRKPKSPTPAAGNESTKPPKRPWLSLKNEALWTTVWQQGGPGRS
jgi:hypothetical protein